MTDAAISVEGLTKRYDKVAALDRHRLRGAGRHRVRPARARTAPARPPPCGCSPRSCGRTRGAPRSWATTSCTTPPPCASRSASPGRTRPSTPTSPAARTCAWSARSRRCRAARSRRGPRSCSSVSTSAAPPTARCAPTRAGCAAGSTSRRRSSSGRPVLFLDEPTTGLDIQSRTELWAVIRELVADGSTVLLTTQYLEEADRLADRIAVVDQGRIVAERHRQGAQGPRRQHRDRDRHGDRGGGPAGRTLLCAPLDLRSRSATAR